MNGQSEKEERDDRNDEAWKRAFVVAEPVPPESPADSEECTPEYRFPAHTYQCRNCKTTLITAVRAGRTHPYLCNLCHSYMRFMWTYWRRVPVVGLRYTVDGGNNGAR